MRKQIKSPIITNKKSVSGMTKILAVSALALMGSLSTAKSSSAVEEIPFKVVEKQESFELRKYNEYLQAETEVQSQFNDAANRAFRLLFRYIAGNNVSQTSVSEKQEKIEMTTPVIQQDKKEKIEMTAPVIQQKIPEKIAMTAPVIQQNKDNKNSTYVVSFVLPQKYTLKTAPIPQNKKVRIKKIPSRLMAALVYSGWWSEENYEKHKSILFKTIDEKGYKVIGSPLYARYNDPFTLWFLRRNEIIVEVKKNA